QRWRSSACACRNPNAETAIAVNAPNAPLRTAIRSWRVLSSIDVSCPLASHGHGATLFQRTTGSLSQGGRMNGARLICYAIATFCLGLIALGVGGPRAFSGSEDLVRVVVLGITIIGPIVFLGLVPIESRMSRNRDGR